MDDFTANAESLLLTLISNPPPGFVVLRSIYNDSGDHAMDWTDYQCAFAACRLAELKSRLHILDIGSYQQFVLGLIAGHEVLSVDVRPRIHLPGEKRIVVDVRNLGNIGEFDVITSLCTLEHVGLGRYGDEIGLDGDRLAFRELRRVLKQNGLFVFSLPITRGLPAIVFNAHRIYNYNMIQGFCEGLSLVKESFFSTNERREIKSDEVASATGVWDIYCGCWRKS